MCAQLDLSPDEADTAEVRIRLMVDWWNDLRVCDDSGATTWEELDKLEREVTDCLAKKPLDVNRVEALTAYAMLLIAGCTEL